MEMTHEFWDFIEKYLPGYYHRDDVLRHSNLQLLVDGQESCITDLTLEEAKAELDTLVSNGKIVAINSFYKSIYQYINSLQSGKKSLWVILKGKSLYIATATRANNNAK
jgi:hypothetical protein